MHFQKYLPCIAVFQGMINTERQRKIEKALISTFKSGTGSGHENKIQWFDNHNEKEAKLLMVVKLAKTFLILCCEWRSVSYDQQWQIRGLKFSVEKSVAIG